MRAHLKRVHVSATALGVCAALALVACPAAPARAAAELLYRGRVLPEHEVRVLAVRALAAPADSAARVAALGAIVTRLQNEGFLDAHATALLDSSNAGARLDVDVREGERYRIGSLRIDVAGRADSAVFTGAVGLAAGEPASPRRVQAAVERAVDTAVERGYAYARIGVTGWTVRGTEVDIVLSGTLGPLVTITRARVEGLHVTRQDVVERAMGPIASRPYDARTAENARQRLEQLGLFSRVTWDGLRGESDWRFGQLVYTVVEPRYNSFDGVVGVQGDAGTVGSARLELGNLLGTGRQLGLAWESRGSGRTDLAVHYREPLLLGLPLAARLGVEQQVQDTFYVRTRWGARLAYAVTAQEEIEAGYEQERDVQERGEVEEAQMQYTVFGAERNALDRRIGARRGSRVRVEAAGIFKRERLRPPGTRKATASAVSTTGEWHRPFGPRSGVTLEWNAAGRFSSQRVLPLYERYPVGGSATLRGYDEEAFRVDRYVVTRLEWRWFFGEGAPRAFVFWDHGWMATREPTLPVGDRLDVLHRDGYGVGLRLEAAGGIVGIDYGLEAGRAPLDGKIHLRLVSTF